MRESPAGLLNTSSTNLRIFHAARLCKLHPFIQMPNMYTRDLLKRPNALHLSLRPDEGMKWLCSKYAAG